MLKHIARRWHNFWISVGTDEINLWVDKSRPPTSAWWVWATNYAEALDYLAKYTVDRAILNGETGLAVALSLAEHPENLPNTCSTRTEDEWIRARLNSAIHKAKQKRDKHESPYRYQRHYL